MRFEEALSLLLFGEMKEKFDDAGPVAVEMSFQVHDGTVPVMPDRLLDEQGIQDFFAAQNLGMDARDQNLFVIGAVKDADPAALREIACGPPQKIVQQFGRAWMLEAEHLTPLRVDPGHHMLDGTIFPAASIAWKISRIAYRFDA